MQPHIKSNKVFLMWSEGPMILGPYQMRITMKEIGE